MLLLFFSEQDLLHNCSLSSFVKTRKCLRICSPSDTYNLIVESCQIFSEIILQRGVHLNNCQTDFHLFYDIFIIWRLLLCVSQYPATYCKSLNNAQNSLKWNPNIKVDLILFYLAHHLHLVGCFVLLSAVEYNVLICENMLTVLCEKTISILAGF